jgi:cAMP-specific phosphodiesterase 4
MKAMEEEEKKDEEGFDSDDDDGELETEMLERMVEKLVRIVSHMTKSDLIIGEDDKNVDSATANWLSATYGDASKRVENIAVESDEGLANKRVTALTSIALACDPEALNSWDFDVLDYDKAQLTDIFVYLFTFLNIFDEFKVQESIFRAFLDELTNRYKDNTYHNFKHGFDVGHTVYRIVTVPNLHVALSHLEFFALLVAAIGHDVGHPGVNNAYLVKAKNELALTHNDRSPLENMHCAVIYNLLAQEKYNIFSGLSESQWRESRKLILTVVLGTDMAHHFEQIGKTNVFLEAYGDDFNKFCSGDKDTIDCMGEEKDRLFLMEICLHCADISNPYKPFKICARWAELVSEEFARQGDRERSEGLEISPMMDRASIQLCNMQMGFVEFVVAPLIIAFIKILPPIADIGTTMGDNYCKWADKRIGEIENESEEKMDKDTKASEIGKLNERKTKFIEKMAFAKDLLSLPKRRSSLSK